MNGAIVSESRPASTRNAHRMTPTPNEYIEAGYEPVNRMANHAITVVTSHPISRNTSTTRCGRASLSSRKAIEPASRGTEGSATTIDAA